MLQSSARDTFANRRSFLTLAIATGAIAPMVGTAFARDRHNHGTPAAGSRSSAQASVRNQKTFQTAVILRDLWLGHIFWVRNVSAAAIEKNDSAVKTSEQQAVANARAIAASIEPFYGAAAKEEFFKLLAGHYGAVKAYLVATVAGDAAAQMTATQSLTSNADEIAAFLSKANPNWPRATLEDLMKSICRRRPTKWSRG